jgi:hypothetical protein
MAVIVVHVLDNIFLAKQTYLLPYNFNIWMRTVDGIFKSQK